MENRYNLYSQGSSGWTSMRNEEFQEEDVWQISRESEDYSDSKTKSSFISETPSFITRHIPTATKMIPKSNKISNSQEQKTIQHSAPVNIPNWSKNYGKSTSKNSCSWFDSDSDANEEGDEDEDEDEDEDGEEGNLMIPPHELIARKLARSEISSFSVCEGAGRTLKGRDLSRVRNAVLIKTGFLES